MSLADDLMKLEELKRTGALTEEEFAQAKAKLLADGPTAATDAVAETLAAQLAETRYQNELARIDREWQIEREKYMAPDRYGRRHVPTVGTGRATSLIGGIFGAFWTIMAFAITSGAPNDGPFVFAKVFFPLFGVAFTVGAIAYGIHLVGKAEAYNRAFAEYQKRREAVNRAHFH
jgi:hypothetical protein